MEGTSLLFDKSLVLGYIPLFSDLGLFEKKLVIDSLEVVQYSKGETIYRQDEPPGAFYCIITGRVRIFVDKDGRQETLEDIHRGKYFGFISLLTGEPHSVSAVAVNDTVIARISKDRFEKVLKRIPRLAIDLSSMLSRRLKRKDVHPKSIFESTILSVYADPFIERDSALYSLNLALSLKKETGKRVILVDLAARNSVIRAALHIEQGPCAINLGQLSSKEDIFRNIVRNKEGIDVLRVGYNPQSLSQAPALTALLTLLVNDYHYCLLHLPQDFGPEAFKILAQSDVVHLLTAPEADSVRRLSKLIEISGILGKQHLKKNVRLLVVEEKGTHGKGKVLSVYQEELLFRLPVFATLPPQPQGEPLLVTREPLAPYSKAIRRISRQLGEVVVGLALGSGSAMGLSHIGVLQILEEEGIPVDIVSGSSIGAMIGAFWAAGYSAGEIETIILKNNKKAYLFGLDDLVFPLRGLIRGRHVRSFLRRYLGAKTFRDMKRPFYAVACDARTMEKTVFESGKLIDAVVASLSIPGVFSPCRIGGKFFIDGGIIDPLPVDALVSAGARKIIAVNVLPSHEEMTRTYFLSLEKRTKPDFQKQGILRYPWYFFRSRFEEWLDPNIFGIIVSSVLSMQYVMAQWRSYGQFDVYLHPDMSGISWSNFEHAGELIERGRREAKSRISQVRALIHNE